MKSLLGLFTDSHEIDQPEGTYRYAKNVVDSETLGALENEKGTVEMLMNITTLPYPLIGAVVLDEGIAVFLTDDVNSEIGLLTLDVNANTSTYTSVYNNPDLEFKRAFPIQGTYQINSLGERIVAFIETNNVPRIINVDDPEISDISDLALFPLYTSAILNTATVNNTGGALLSGSYVPFTRYKQNDGTLTNYIVHNKALQITSSLTSTSFDSFTGSPRGTPSSKSISWGFTDLDTTYDMLEVGVLAMVNGVVQPRLLTTVNIIGTTLNYTYTGTEVGTDLTLAEVLTPAIAYESAKAITQLNNTLLLGNLTARNAPDLQATANQVTINYTWRKVAVRSNTDSPGNHRDMGIQAGFRSGEVYAFYLVVEMMDGTEYAYHIPGRGPTTGETDAVSDPSGTGLDYLYYQAKNTTSASGAYSNMGFWQNQDEVYPLDFPAGRDFTGNPEALAGQLVRHHKFPYIDTLMVDSGQDGDPTIGVTHYLQLGVSVSGVDIPGGILPDVKRWKIAYAQKNEQNSMMLGSDLLQHGSTRTISGGSWNPSTNKLFNGGNWTISTYNSLHVEIGRNELDRSVFRGHAPDFLLSRPPVVPAFARFPYKLRVTGLDVIYAGSNSSGIVNNWNRAEQAGGAVCDFTSATASRTTITDPDNFQAIIDFQYLAQNALDGDLSTRYASESLYGQFVNPSLLSAYSDITDGRVDTTAGASSADTDLFTASFPYEDAPLMEYCQLLRNINIGFVEQTLLVTDKIQSDPTITILSDIYGGDSFIGTINFISTVAAGTATGDGYRSSVRNCFFFKSFIGESKHNWNIRHEGEDIGKKFAPATAPKDFWSLPLVDGAITTNSDSLLNVDTIKINDYQYNTDYDLRPPLKALIISDLDEFTTGAPTTIIRSQTQSVESDVTSWQTFLASDRWVQPKNKGEITNLEAIGNEDLLIHHKHSFYVTKTNVGLGQQESEDITLKSVDLFSIPPREILTTEGGFAGTQNPLSCKMTKYGYFFVDDLQRKVFLYSQNQLQEISAIGLRKFFRDFVAVGKDNPFLDKGFTVGYDMQYNRLIVTKRNSTDNESFTISYSTGNSRPHWVSFHDYTPDFFVETTDGRLYSFKDQRIHQHSIGVPGTYYGSTFPTMVDVVYQGDNGRSVIFGSVDWMALVYDGDNVLTTETFDYITARTFDKCSGRIALEPLVNIATFYDSNIRSLNQVWHYNALRDISIDPGFLTGFYDGYEIDPAKLNSNVPWYRQRLLADKYLVCRYEYANLDGNQLLFLGHNVNSLPVIR